VRKPNFGQNVKNPQIHNVVSLYQLSSVYNRRNGIDQW